MESKDATPLLAKRLRETPKFYIQIPMSVSNVNEVTRRATRPVDPIIHSYKRYPRTTGLTAFVWFLVLIGSAWGIYELIFG